MCCRASWRNDGEPDPLSVLSEDRLGWVSTCVCHITLLEMTRKSLSTAPYIIVCIFSLHRTQTNNKRLCLKCAIVHIVTPVLKILCIHKVPSTHTVRWVTFVVVTWTASYADYMTLTSDSWWERGRRDTRDCCKPQLPLPPAATAEMHDHSFGVQRRGQKTTTHIWQFCLPVTTNQRMTMITRYQSLMRTVTYLDDSSRSITTVGKSKNFPPRSWKE